MRKKGLLFFAIGLMAGLLGNLAARKASRKMLNIFEGDWYNSEDMQHW